MHRSIKHTLDRLPETRAEYFNDSHGRFAWQIQEARASEASCWRRAQQMMKNARAWKRQGDMPRAQMCIESALVARGNALAYRRTAEMIGGAQ